jgi:hypothetical protein
MFSNKRRKFDKDRYLRQLSLRLLSCCQNFLRNCVFLLVVLNSADGGKRDRKVNIGCMTTDKALLSAPDRGQSLSKNHVYARPQTRRPGVGPPTIKHLSRFGPNQNKCERRQIRLVVFPPSNSSSHCLNG